MSRILLLSSAVAVAVAVTSCGTKKSDPTVTAPPAPAAIQVSPSSTQTLDAFQASQSLTATVTSSNGAVLTDAVTWQSDSPGVVTVTGPGATATVTAISNGTAHITARTSNGITSSPVTIIVQQLATKLTRVSGDAQTGAVNTKLTAPLVVLAADRNNNPAEGATVGFAATAGTLATPTATTGTNGQASNTWTLPTVASSHTVTATLVSSPTATATFTATATAGPAQRLLKIDGDAQRGTVSVPLPTPIVAAVVDQFGNGVPGVAVAMVAQAGSGSVSPTSVTSNATGQAQTIWTLGSVASTSQTVTATVTGLTGSPLTFTATALNASLDNLGPSPFKGGCKISGILSGVTVADKPHISVTVNGVSVPSTDVTLVGVSGGVSISIVVPTLPLTTETIVPVIVRVYSQNVQPAAGPVRYSPTASC